MADRTSDIVDPSLAEAGRSRIDWAADFMPALAAVSADPSAEVLRGRRVGVVLTLEPKTANLALALHRSGAEVSVFCSGTHTSDDVAAALDRAGVATFARSDADAAVDQRLLDRFLDQRIEFLIDDGAATARHMHTHRRDALESLVGIAEETTSGVRPLRVMADEGALAVPAIAVNDAACKQLFDNVYGTGQSVVMTLLDLTNTQLQGKLVVVVGYGYVGRGIADTAHALGARVVVTEVDPVRALQALHDGYRVETLEAASREGDVFFTATGIGYSLTGDHIRSMKDGAMVAVGGAGPPEVSLDGGNPVVRGGFARSQVRVLQVASDREVHLIADGECCNVAAAEGNPIEIMDLSLAVQFRAVVYLAQHAAGMAPGVYPVPPEVDDQVARAVLGARGIEIDVPTAAQISHANNWNESIDEKEAN